MNRDSPTNNLRRSLIPTAASIAIHAALFAAVLGVTVTQIVPEENRPRLLDIDTALAPNSAADAADPVPAETPPRSPAASPETRAADTAQQRRIESARATATENLAARVNAPPPPAPRPVAPPPIVRAPRAAPAATFAGLEARAATRIVYAVDASGAMVHTLSFILDELARSIDRLQPTQAYQIVLFSDRPGEPPFRTPPLEPDMGELIRATGRNTAATREWLATVVAGGRSNPLDGLRAALGLDPDLVFLLARGIQRTGAEPGLTDHASDHVSGPDAVLARLDALNPVDARTGLRPAVIKTLQFIEEDPTGLMPRIARAHGDGAGSYRLITPDDLGRPPEVSIDDGPELALDTKADLDTAAAALADVERDLTAHAVLAGVATPEETAAVRAAAAAALDALADAPPATTRTADGRPQLLRARAALLRAAAEPEHSYAGRARRIDLARRALADAGPLPLIDPAADADRDLLVAEATRLLDNPDEALAELTAIIRYRDDLGLGPHVLASARIALLTAATDADPEGADARRARDAVRSALDADRRDTDRADGGAWADPAWRALAAAALSRSLREAGRPTGEVVAPLLAELNDRGVAEPHRRALVSPRLSAVAGELPGLPARALGAVADQAAWAGRPEEAAGLLLRAVEAAEDPAVRGGALRDAASLLHSIDDPRAPGLFFRLAAEFPDHPDAADALSVALDPDGGLADPAPGQLATALRVAPDHPMADRWRVMLARATRGEAGLDLLEPIDPLTSDAAELAIELVGELLDANPGDAGLLERAARVAERAGGELPASRRLGLARGLLETDPARALETLDGVGRGSAGADRADLYRVRALLALGREPEAFGLARSLAQRREARLDAVFWEAATVWLELGAERGGPDARSAIAAHVARLRRLDPALGGTPWSGRLERLAR